MRVETGAPRRARGLRACALALALVATAACGRDIGVKEAAAVLTGGSPDRGRAVIPHYGCPACHTIPGVPGANAKVGPPLAGIIGRAYVGGVLPNTPENLMRWIQNPPAVDPLTAMPNVGVTQADARDIAAYLYTLRTE